MDNNLTLKLPRKKASLDKRRARSGYFFTLPFIIGIIFVYLPILVDSILLSFYNYEPIENAMIDGQLGYVFHGGEYYAMAFDDPAFVEALIAGFQELLLQVPTIVIFSLFIAVILNQKMLGRAAFRAIFFVPVIIATGLGDVITSAGVDVASIDDGSASAAQGGILQAEDLTEMFAGMGFGADVATFVVDLVNGIYNIINYSGVQMLIFLAALQGISPAIYEACTIDGATGWETFWKITFPMISPMILVNAAYTIIDSFTRSSNSVMLFIYGDTLSPVNRIAGEAAAMAWIYFGIAIVVIVLVAAIISSFVFYQRRD